MKRDTRGFYTLEAAIFLPLVLLAVFSLGYFMKAEASWERAMFGALDECARSSSMACDGLSGLAASSKVQERMDEGATERDSFTVKDARMMSPGGISSMTICTEVDLELPLGFSHTFEREDRIKYRNFIGRKYRGVPAGAELLERRTDEDSVCIFPHSGKRYHHEDCTYVKPDVRERILTPGLREKYDSCGICDSEKLLPGAKVYCFRSRGSAYHRGDCSTVQKNYITIDRKEAKKKGYTPCRKCGGG